VWWRQRGFLVRGSQGLPRSRKGYVGSDGFFWLFCIVS
jgi:hypothetical protein